MGACTHRPTTSLDHARHLTQLRVLLCCLPLSKACQCTLIRRTWPEARSLSETLLLLLLALCSLLLSFARAAAGRSRDFELAALFLAQAVATVCAQCAVIMRFNHGGSQIIIRFNH